MDTSDKQEQKGNKAIELGEIAIVEDFVPEDEVVENSFVYFSPPVMLETNVSAAPIRHPRSEMVIEQLNGIDKEIDLVIQPHYREGKTEELEKIFTNAKFLEPEADPLPTIQESSAVLTHRNSTTVLDAIACGKMSVLVNFTDALQSSFKRHYFEEFATENYNSTQCIESLKSHKKLQYANYINRAKPYIYLGNCSGRIQKLILRDGYN